MKLQVSKAGPKEYLIAIVKKINELDALCQQADYAEVDDIFLTSWPYSRTREMRLYISRYFDKCGWAKPWE